MGDPDPLAVGKAANALLVISGRTPYTLSVVTGALPPGLKLSTGGHLVGTPTKAGTYTFTLHVVDANSVPNPVNWKFTVVVNAGRSVAGEAVFVAPSRSRTPGVANPVVTQRTIKTTICAPGWMATIQPPVSFTNTLKLRQMKEYGETGSPSAYDEDHLIPLELGGAPRNPKNLWPEPHTQSKHSDPLETSLKRKVCGGALTLAAARQRILTYKRIHG